MATSQLRSLLSTARADVAHAVLAVEPDPDRSDALGLTPVHINRVLREMRSRALITLRHQTLVIEAWDDLLQASEFDPTYLYLEMRAAA
ncbi:hypothetical protein OMR07_01390 [Methylobacterium organophilum]|nr:hypothetical protein [Methylobacterium organophilum]